MKAVVVSRFGGPDVLEIADVPMPEPAADQVRIRVQAAAVNPIDITTRAGWLADSGLMAAGSEIGIGWDLAGVVNEVGPDVDQFAVGDPVIGMRDLSARRSGHRRAHRSWYRRGRARAPQRLASAGVNAPAQRPHRHASPGSARAAGRSMVARHRSCRGARRVRPRARGDPRIANTRGLIVSGRGAHTTTGGD